MTASQPIFLGEESTLSQDQLDQPNWLVRRLFGLIECAGVLGCAATLFGFMGGIFWFFDLASHFRVQYFLGLALIAVISVIRKKRVFAATFAAFALVNAFTIVPLYFKNGEVNDASDDAGKSYRIVVLNVNTRNQRHDLVIEFLKRENADFVLLQELNHTWRNALLQLDSIYPCRLIETRDDNFGIGFFAKNPVKKLKIVEFGDAEVPSIVVQMEMDGETIHFIGTHPTPPVSALFSSWRDQQLNKVAEYLNERQGSKIVAGDLNCSPWSRAFKRFLAQAKLKDSAKGFGVQATWPTSLTPLWIPIDQLLYSGKLIILNRRVGPNVGSDHYPIIIDLKARP